LRDCLTYPDLVWPQLGDFDSLEYAWWLQHEAKKLPFEQLAIRAVGIGDRSYNSNI
jgi:hypothetical protein